MRILWLFPEQAVFLADQLFQSTLGATLFYLELAWGYFFHECSVSVMVCQG